MAGAFSAIRAVLVESVVASLNASGNKSVKEDIENSSETHLNPARLRRLWLKCLQEKQALALPDSVQLIRDN